MHMHNQTKAEPFWAWIRFHSGRKAKECLNDISSVARVHNIKGFESSSLRRDSNGLKEVHFIVGSRDEATRLARFYRHRESHGWETTDEERKSAKTNSTLKYAETMGKLNSIV